MAPLLARLRALLTELKRRNVFKVAVAYIVVGLAVIEAAESLVPHLRLPGLLVTAVVALVILGLPIALVLAWAFELTPDGIYRTAARLHNDAGETLAAGQPTQRTEAVEAEPDSSAGAPAPARLESSAVPAGPLNSLPPAPTRFVGRADELAHLRELLGNTACRLLTITGPGGAGKSRLALELAGAQAQDFPHGVCFVPLSGVASSAFLHSAIAERLELRPTGREDARTQLLTRLRARRILLVLDNFEHLAEGSVLVAELLEHAPELRIVVTSRERLNLQVETVFAIAGLQLPTGDDEVLETESARLFVHTATRLDPGFRPTPVEALEIQRICHETEGFPLAIELAAGWIGTLSCREIADEIARNRDFLFGSARDFPERHRSLRAVFESSWRLLPEAEKATFRRLSVFRGGFGRAAAQRVGGASLQLLSSLLDKSLIRRSYGGRYEIHELLRSYAEERLQAEGSEQEWTRRLHAEYYAELLDQLEPQLEGPDDGPALAQLGEESANCREAWRWAVEARRVDLLAMMVDGLFSFYYAYNWAREGESVLADALEILTPPSGPVEATLLARVRSRLGAFSVMLGAYDRARSLLEEALAHFRNTGDAAEAAFALYRLGHATTHQGEYEVARAYLVESLRIAHSLSNPRMCAMSSSLLGNITWAGGEYHEAHRLWSGSLTIFRQLGDRRGTSSCLRNLGGIAMLRGSHAEAVSLLQESLSIDRSLDNRLGIANSLQNLGCVMHSMGDYAESERYLLEGASLSREIGSPRLEALCLSQLGHVYVAQTRLSEADSQYRQALEIASHIKETPTVLETLLGMADLSRHQQSRPRARHLLSIVIGHPATDQEARTRAQALWDEVTDDPGLLATDASPADLHAAVSQILELPPISRLVQ